MYSFRSIALVQQPYWTSESRLASDALLSIQEWLNSSKNIFSFFLILCAVICGAQDKELCSEDEQSNLEITKLKRLQLKSDSLSQKRYLDSLTSSRIYNDNHIEYHFYATDKNDIDQKVSNIISFIKDWFWSIFTPFLIFLGYIFFPRLKRIMRNIKKEPLKHLAINIKRFSPPLFYRWLRSKVYKFYISLL